MGRWAYLDSDEERLPEGIRRTGYDADTQTYTYSDERGKPWVGVPGARYGTLRRANTEPRRSSAPPLPSYKSGKVDAIHGEEPAQVLHDYEPDTDDGDKEKKTTFDAILGTQQTSNSLTGTTTTEPKKAHLKRWSSVSRAVNRFIPKLPPLPPLPGEGGSGGGEIAAVEDGEKKKGEEEGEAKEASDEKKPLPPLPRRRASTMSRFTRSAALGVKQMFSDESEFRGRRG